MLLVVRYGKKIELKRIRLPSTSSTKQDYSIQTILLPLSPSHDKSYEPCHQIPQLRSVSPSVWIFPRHRYPTNLTRTTEFQIPMVVTMCRSTMNGKV